MLVESITILKLSIKMLKSCDENLQEPYKLYFWSCFYEQYSVIHFITAYDKIFDNFAEELSCVEELWG